MNDVDQRIREALRGAADRFEPDSSLSLPRVHHRARVLRIQTLVYFLVVALVVGSGALIGVRTIRSAQDGSFVDTNPKHEADPNFNTARAETVRLLNLFKPPAGATRVGSTPSPYLASPPSRPSASHFIYTARWWTISQPFSSTDSWLTGYALPGFTKQESGSGGGPNYSSAEIELLDPRKSRAYENATLMISIVSLGPQKTGIRADGAAVWLSSKPTPVSKTGPSLHVNLADGCPTSLGGYEDVSNEPENELLKRLLPHKDPVSGLRCFYQARRPGSTVKLAKQKALEATAARELQLSINRLNLGSPGDEVILGCPAFDLHQTEILIFRYESGPDIDLWHSLYCVGGLDNGFIGGFGLSIPGF